MSRQVVIVGASMGGLRAAEQLRAAGWDGGITVVGAEPHLPYNRPPLSKEVLAGQATDPAEAHAALAFRRRASLDDVDWRLGVPAVSADLERRAVGLADGTTLSYDGLVVASGLRPRRLPMPEPSRGRHVLRTVGDAVGLRAELTPGARVVVVGAGFIGCEVAATARRLGCDVTVVEPAGVPMGRVLGDELGLLVQGRHEAEGVRFRLGRVVAALHGGERVTDVELDDGTVLRASVVVEAVGSYANVEWLQGTGLDLSDGLLCDNLMRVEGRPDVVAVGDVARFPNPRFDTTARRVEHWCMPTETARRAARTLAAHLAAETVDEQQFTPLPTFWSDQFDLRLQSFGAPALADRVEVLEGVLSAPSDLAKGVAVGYRRGAALVGVVTVNLPARSPHYRKLVDTGVAVPA
ncbi:NAD(P)/FAD-dependent oxidoreductase [Streptomyces ossamyceticus]|uniref:NAD(P)/FAD-dependent oxidoreductase n=1 Tax=Streptomyces ossamyceticus TaxID=249581 RepID=UPI0006E15E13|nr:FAD-dependent oxidoreductase [Streptomyces ossamyceticus]